jgi:hypothetical protein
MPVDRIFGTITHKKSMQKKSEVVQLQHLTKMAEKGPANIVAFI